MTYHLTNTKIGDILILERLPNKNTRGKIVWKCRCLCGNIFEAETSRLTGIKSRQESCGHCYWHIKHKEAYTSWMSMKSRCDGTSKKDIKYYIDKGIDYDPRWVKFTEFYKDMGDPPKDWITGERLSIDRIDNTKNYCKDNCRWATREQQQQNKGKI